MKIGDRIEFDKKFGSIRYIGPVNASSNTWYGIEWDDPNRGKHDGSYQGTKYFSTKHPTSGSFVKPESCEKNRSFFDSILEQYCITDADMKEEAKFGSRSSTVQYKTDENSIRLHKLTNAILFGQHITSLGDVGLVQASCPNIELCDLSYNLLANWSDVAEIAEEMPNLKTLILNGNRLVLDVKVSNEIDSKTDHSKSNPFLNVSNLCLKDMDLVCSDVSEILIRCNFVSCSELHLCDNRIYTIDSVEAFNNVRHIDLENNKLESWDEVLKLGTLPTLNTLQLNKCSINSIYFHKVPSGNDSSVIENNPDALNSGAVKINTNFDANGDQTRSNNDRNVETIITKKKKVPTATLR